MKGKWGGGGGGERTDGYKITMGDRHLGIDIVRPIDTK